MKIALKQARPRTNISNSAIWKPFTQHAVEDPPLFVERAKGASLFCKDGRKLFDAISSWWVTLHGHANPRIAKAVAAQAKRLEQVIFTGFTHAPAEELARRLLELLPKDLSRVFFSDDGSTAVEVAIKMAVGSWSHRGAPRRRIVALESAYHGDTFGAMSIGDDSVFTAPYKDMLFSVSRLPFPAPGREDATVDAWRKLLKTASREIAALIVEPLVLGAGGMRMYPPTVLKGLADECARAGIPLIVDEVMTGFGRTGTLFAFEQAGIVPDIVCLSKGITGGFLPLGVTVASDAIYRAFLSKDRSKTFFHGHSYTANPIACAAACASLDIFRTEPVLDRIRKIGGIHARELRRFAGHSSVAETRQRGTIAAVELRVGDPGYLSELGPKLRRFYLSRGVLLRPLGNVVYLLPPYCTTNAELQRTYDAIEESLDLI